MAVNVSMRESMVVKPAVETPRQSRWMSNLDMISSNAHTLTIYIYNPKDGTGADNDSFFDLTVLKHVLSKAIMPFYPLAGHLMRNNDDKNARIEINCNINADGVLFVVANSSSCANDFANFKATLEFGRRLIPAVDYSVGISSFPLFVAQIMYFKCSGVALGIAFEHSIAK
ncbi:hypothetical protein M0R45_000458 [Rubus argutus]|uniref:Uncharacterized protein n=1 Tax=Rubus argutus TaxID=59490 RepID=A0AAW1VN53_RUBAR